MNRPFKFIEGKLTSRQEFQVTNGRQPTYALIYLKAGSFSLEVNGVQSIIEKGDCCIFPDDIDFLRSVIIPISFIYLKFMINPNCPITFPLPTGKVVFRDRLRFISNIEQYESLLGNPSAHALYYREHIMEDILIQACLEYDSNLFIHSEAHDSIEYAIQNCHDPIVKAAIKFIRSSLHQKLSIDSICHATGTNASTLNFKFRKELSCTVNAFISSEKMKLASHLLTNTTFSVSEIASRCGFENIYYFSNVFSKHHEMSPTDYRKSHRQF